MTHGGFVDALEVEAASFVAALRGIDLDAPVPTCPGWDVRALTEHLGSIHRWAGTIVARRSPVRLGRADVDLGLPADDHAAWLEAGAREVLLPALREVDPDAPVWSWGADQHARFWSRRQLHETAIHRADLLSATGDEASYPDEVAIDGVEEFLENLPSATWNPGLAQLRGSGETIALRAGDVAWTIALRPEGLTWARSDDAADATVVGAPADVYLFMWGRRAPQDMKVEGDEAMVARWARNTAL